jgi:predicted secreted hydrolase
MRARYYSRLVLLRALAFAMLFPAVVSAPASAQPAPSFAPALPGYEYSFPRDHGTHDEYKTEWWYYTGHFVAKSGKRYGFELTFFRVGIEPPSATPPRTRWDLRDLSLAHFAITDVDGKAFRYYEKLNRSSPFTASQASGYLDVFNEGWRASTLADGAWRIVARGGADSLDLTLRTRKPPAVHGENGVSVKAEGVGYASHYYSMTRLEATGRVNGEEGHGLVWMDHEFGSSQLRESQSGWDWFSIQLDNETELMLYQIRRRDGTADVTSSGSLVTADGNVIHLRHDQFRVEPAGKWRSAKSGATYPMGWRVSVPSFRIAVVLQPVLREQELVTKSSTHVTYWEGAVTVEGSSDATAVQGEGYVEMTGYDRAFRAP